MKIKPAHRPGEALHAPFYLLLRYAIQPGQSHGSYSVLYVDLDRNAQLDIPDTYIRSHEIKKDFTVPDADANPKPAFGAGEATKVILDFQPRDIDVSLKPAEWTVVNENINVELGVTE